MSYDSPELPSGRREPSWSTGHGQPEPSARRSGPHRTLRMLRRAYRWQRRVASLAALGYFAVFLTLTVKAPWLMTRPGPGGLPTGLLLALAQIPVTWLAVLLYEVTAHRLVDPLARRARQSYPAPAHREGGR
ncbi:DUF485 domain-containing protein [Streptomyces sp. NPDC004673]